MAAAESLLPHPPAKPRRARRREHVGLASFIAEPVLSPCIVRGVDVPGSTSECNRRGPPTGKPWGSLAEPTMLWPFNHFSKPRMPSRGTIETIYGMIVTQAREPLFYRDFGVPDTVDGRFDLLVLHLWLVLRRFKLAEDGTALSQALFDRF